MAADKLRLKEKLAILSKSDMLEVEQAICVHLGLPK
jgi:mRNA-degrading endonuclease toxin of MazEF toxin-antitoxin module